MRGPDLVDTLDHDCHRSGDQEDSNDERREGFRFSVAVRVAGVGRF